MSGKQKEFSLSLPNPFCAGMHPGEIQTPIISGLTLPVGKWLFSAAKSLSAPRCLFPSASCDGGTDGKAAGIQPLSSISSDPGILVSRAWPRSCKRGPGSLPTVRGSRKQELRTSNDERTQKTTFHCIPSLYPAYRKRGQKGSMPAKGEPKSILVSH